MPLLLQRVPDGPGHSQADFNVQRAGLQADSCLDDGDVRSLREAKTVKLPFMRTMFKSMSAGNRYPWRYEKIDDGVWRSCKLHSGLKTKGLTQVPCLLNWIIHEKLILKLSQMGLQSSSSSKRVPSLRTELGFREIVNGKVVR